jgi:hypothetical protein
MKLLLTLLCSVICLNAAAQIKQESDTTVVEFTKVQQMPEYKGGKPTRMLYNLPVKFGS